MSSPFVPVQSHCSFIQLERCSPEDTSRLGCTKETSHFEGATHLGREYPTTRRCKLSKHPPPKRGTHSRSLEGVDKQKGAKDKMEVVLRRSAASATTSEGSQILQDKAQRRVQSALNTKMGKTHGHTHLACQRERLSLESQFTSECQCAEPNAHCGFGCLERRPDGVKVTQGRLATFTAPLPCGGSFQRGLRGALLPLLPDEARLQARRLANVFLPAFGGSLDLAVTGLRMKTLAEASRKATAYRCIRGGADRPLDTAQVCATHGPGARARLGSWVVSSAKPVRDARHPCTCSSTACCCSAWSESMASAARGSAKGPLTEGCRCAAKSAGKMLPTASASHLKSGFKAPRNNCHQRRDLMRNMRVKAQTRTQRSQRQNV